MAPDLSMLLLAVGTLRSWKTSFTKKGSRRVQWPGVQARSGGVSPGVGHSRDVGRADTLNSDSCLSPELSYIPASSGKKRQEQGGRANNSKGVGLQEREPHSFAGYLA